jgi:hypothetical protein
VVSLERKKLNDKSFEDNERTLVELESFFFLTLILEQLRLLLPGCLVFRNYYYYYYFFLLAKRYTPRVPKQHFRFLIIFLLL